MVNTEEQFDTIIAICRDIYAKKLQDYGASWRVMRPFSVTDQLFIKTNRIRSIEQKGEARINEDARPELIGIVNYAIIGLIQLERGFTNKADISAGEALELYDRHIEIAKQLMLAKNHDYDEAWRSMRSASYIDLILVKLHRIKQIEDNLNQTLISEGIDANYMDIINYAIFGLIKIYFN